MPKDIVHEGESDDVDGDGPHVQRGPSETAPTVMLLSGVFRTRECAPDVDEIAEEQICAQHEEGSRYQHGQGAPGYTVIVAPCRDLKGCDREEKQGDQYGRQSDAYVTGILVTGHRHPPGWGNMSLWVKQI